MTYFDRAMETLRLASDELEVLVRSAKATLGETPGLEGELSVPPEAEPNAEDAWDKAVALRLGRPETSEEKELRKARERHAEPEPRENPMWSYRKRR